MSELKPCPFCGNPFPTIEPHWIPCIEKLPDGAYPVIVTWENQYNLGKYYTGVAHYNGKWFWYSSVTEDLLIADEVDEAIEVIAWMPLPAPYKEGESV